MNAEQTAWVILACSLSMGFGFLWGYWSQRMVVNRYKQYLTWEHDTTERNIQEIQKLLPANVFAAQWLLSKWLQGVRESGFRSGSASQEQDPPTP